jgi:hypothetical protein
MSSRELIDCLERVDIHEMRRLWEKVSPQFPIHDDAGMRAAIHMARTKSEMVRFKLRAYSHAWLIDHGYPSLLPDELRPKAQRIYPVTAHAVGIAVQSKYDEVRATVTQAMQGAVLEAEADGRLADSPFVKDRMQDARMRALKQLFGSW